jgi:hypothetical protein
MLNDAYPSGLYNYYKLHYISRISEELIDTIVDPFVKVPSPMSALGFEQFGGAMRRVGVEGGLRLISLLLPVERI